jgi:hypothetical protein
MYIDEGTNKPFKIKSKKIGPFLVEIQSKILKYHDPQKFLHLLFRSGRIGRRAQK